MKQKTTFEYARYGRLRQAVRTPIFLGLTGIAMLALSGCGKDSAHGNSASPVLVKVVEIAAASKKSGEEMKFTGVVRARTESSQGFRVAGKITERLVSAGETVKKGQDLLRLDPVDFNLTLSSAEAEADVARAVNTQADLAKTRAKKLFEVKGISREALEQAVADAESSAARWHSAKSQVEQAANQSTYTTLTADTDGVVMSTLGYPSNVAPLSVLDGRDSS